MRYMTRYDLQKVAGRVLCAYWRLPEAQENPYCVDMLLLAKKLLGLRVLYRHLSSDGRTVGITSYGQVELALRTRPLCSERIGWCFSTQPIRIRERSRYQKYCTAVWRVKGWKRQKVSR